MKDSKIARGLLALILVGSLSACQGTAVSGSGSVGVAGGSTVEPVASTLTFSVEGEGFTDTSTPLALQLVSAEGSDDEEAYVAYVDSEHTSVELPAGTYMLTCTGSPINADGNLYSMPTDSLEVVVSPDGTSELSLTLQPLDAREASEEYAQAAREAAHAAVNYLQDQGDDLVDYLAPRVEENIAALDAARA